MTVTAGGTGVAVAEGMGVAVAVSVGGAVGVALGGMAVAVFVGGKGVGLGGSVVFVGSMGIVVVVAGSDAAVLQPVNNASAAINNQAMKFMRRISKEAPKEDARIISQVR
jgi:hypothetical protein